MKIFLLRHRRLVVTSGVVALAALLSCGTVMQFQRPIPEVSVVGPEAPAGLAPSPPQIAWPPSGQAGISVAGVGLIGESPEQEPRSIASLVKVMTAYVVLKHHPLNTGEPGPEIEFNEQHVAAYRTRSANVESVVPVSSGGKMTQRELLRGLLLASGNNLADVLAEWHAGSVDAFVEQMNAEARTLGMDRTNYADAAGLLPASISTAHDQLILADAAMSDPTFASIVRETQAILPGAGVVYNTNSALGTDGIVGVKTGWTEEAGACFVFAAQSRLEGRTVTVIGVVLGQDTLADALARSRELIRIAGGSVTLAKVGSEGDVIGQIKSRWGDSAGAILSKDVSLVLVPGMEIETSVEVMDSGEIAKGQEIGVIRFSAGDQFVEVPLRASAAIQSPDLLWRVTRIQ
jgi:D-alanyl-D-alanine carboxypeptidase (penicillin-binding protein 5/6)